MLSRHFSYHEVCKRKKTSIELQKIEQGSKCLLPCVRCYEKIGMGIRTTLEYFYPKFKIVFISACPEQLHPVSLLAKSKSPEVGLFEVSEGSQNLRPKEAIVP